MCTLKILSYLILFKLSASKRSFWYIYDETGSFKYFSNQQTTSKYGP